nr:hypothetical protein [Tanacetum cinerariifolium]
MIVDSIENGPYVRRMIAIPGEPDLPVPVPESFHEQTDEELTENDLLRTLFYVAQRLCFALLKTLFCVAQNSVLRCSELCFALL